jgi:hypothetical protein
MTVSHIIQLAILESFLDYKVKLFSGIPLFSGSMGFFLNIESTLSLITLLIGMVVGILGIFSKAIEIITNYKKLKKIDKENDLDNLNN